MTSIAAPTPADLVPRREHYDRHRWESVVIASDLHRGSRLVALTLAHYAGDAGYLPPGGIQHPDVLAAATNLSTKNIRLSINQLQARGLIRRPDIATWTHEAVRPITLTLPRSARREPANTSEAER